MRGDICDAERGARGDERAATGRQLRRRNARGPLDLEPGAFVKTDVEGTYTLLEAAREPGIERFIQISTDEVYGNAEPPTAEPPSLETDALKPLSPYAAARPEPTAWPSPTGQRTACRSS